MTRTRIVVRRLLARVRTWEVATRLASPETRDAMARRWAGLPAAVRTPAQVIGRAGVGCEGTHGVFPRCDLTCSPCYHSAEANRVRVDGDHTRREVGAQMTLLRRLRGPRAHAQLIGGEVSLLDPDDHAAALLAMRAAGREPMSMSHGDFDADYLERLVTAPDGSLRLRRVSFAGHFDSLMRGRRGLPRPRHERDLTEHRRAFAAMFADLRRRRGVRSYLAHTMTVTRANLDQVPEVAAEVPAMGFSMLSFQPAARVGDPRRWDGPDAGVDLEEVWGRLEAGIGRPIPFGALSFGHPRCNRTAFGLRVGTGWAPLLDEADPVDLLVRDRYLHRYGVLQNDPDRPWLAPLRLARALGSRPADVVLLARWGHQFLRRCGGLRTLGRHVVRREVAPLTFVVHAFMDADLVTPAWAALQAGVTSSDPTVREAQDRLSACVYSMAHPESGTLVPACAQHSVLDPDANRRLAVLLPMPTVRDRARP